ncbi:hypothetical protein CspHIS471_0703880 [Cutaneotrichosporon sp. HIS471]|nr:hypothetical protein CspHIS471_0703880 [Cutaneotrichosporon sp. HIS471]
MYIPQFIAPAVALLRFAAIPDAPPALSVLSEAASDTVALKYMAFVATKDKKWWGVGMPKAEDGAVLEMVDLGLDPMPLLAYWERKDYISPWGLLQLRDTDLCMNATVEIITEDDGTQLEQATAGPVYLRKCPKIPTSEDDVPWDALPMGAFWKSSSTTYGSRTFVSRDNVYLTFKFGEAKLWGHDWTVDDPPEDATSELLVSIG